MSDSKPLEYRVTARRQDAHGSLATCKGASITLDTDLGGREDAFNPAELLLAALAACMLKGIERVTPMLTITKSSSTPTSLTDGSICYTKT